MSLQSRYYLSIIMRIQRFVGNSFVVVDKREGALSEFTFGLQGGSRQTSMK